MKSQQLLEKYKRNTLTLSITHPTHFPDKVLKQNQHLLFVFWPYYDVVVYFSLLLPQCVPNRLR